MRTASLVLVLVLGLGLVAGGSALAGDGCEIGKLLDVDLEEGALFGGSVAIQGNLAVVGASHFGIPAFHPGAAFVFRFDGDDWALEQPLAALDGEIGDEFGHAVAVDGDVIVVSARGDGPEYQAGTAYIFRFDGASWIEEQKIEPETSTVLGWYGWSIAIRGDTVMVGEPSADGGLGAVHVYEHDAGAWSLAQVLHASDAPVALGERFGRSISIDGGRAVVGASHDDELGNRTGAAYVFEHDGAGWVEVQKLRASDAADRDRFGNTVSLDGDRLAVGAYGADAAYVFARVDGAWEQQQRLLARDGEPGDDFGRVVALDGNVIVVGSGSDDNENGSEAGAAYVFRFSDIWHEEQKLSPDDGAANDHFGSRVAVSGDTGLIGAQNDDNFGNLSGSAYVFTGLSGVDCNLNGVADGCDLHGGGSQDRDGNGIPDECEIGGCPADVTGDGEVDVQDLVAVILAWGEAGGAADVDQSGLVDVQDLVTVILEWGSCR